MAIIINQNCAVPSADIFEATGGAPEFLERFPNLFHIQLQFVADRDNGSGVQDIVLAGQLDLEFSQSFIPKNDFE